MKPIPAKIFAATTALTALLFAGCASETRTVDAKGPESLNTSAINPQDWANAADQLTGSLITSGALEKTPHQPAVLAIDRVLNNTQIQVDTDLLIKKIRVALTQTGKVAVTNTFGLGERATVAEEAKALDQEQSGVKEKKLVPDYTLYAKLIQQTDRTKGVSQDTYAFQMSLVQVKTGLTVWEDERQIAKQTKRKTVGW